METIPAKELKIKGVGAIEAALKHDSRAIVTVRGEATYVIMPLAEYSELREAELLNIADRARSDYAAGKLKTITSVEEHMAEIDRMIADGV